MSVQLSFAPHIAIPAQSVQLVGSWDCYQSQLPLHHRSGGWRGKYKFSAPLITAGTRYWYYYIVDGCKAVHDEAHPSTIEPTTGRTLNVLDIAVNTVAQPSLSIDTRIARGRPVSPSQIVSPRPVKPNESKQVLNYQTPPQNNWVDRFGRMGVTSGSSSRSSSRSTTTSIADSDVPSLTSSRGSFNTTPTSISSGGSGACICQRYGITRRGERVKLDCGGTICGSDSSSSSSCSDGDDDDVRQHVTTVAAVGATSSAQPRLRVNTNVGVAVNQLSTPIGPGMTPVRASPLNTGKLSAVEFAVRPPSAYYAHQQPQHYYAHPARARQMR